MNARLRELHAMKARIEEEIRREEAFMLRLAQVRDMFHDTIESSAPSVRATLVAVAAEFDFSVADLMDRFRTAPQTAARHVAAAALRRQGFSFPEIGRILDRNHSTVMHSCRVVAAAPELVAVVDRVERRLAGEYAVEARIRLAEVS